jgi:glycosyl hydrolase family 39 (putative alpha-L-iduronidase)/PKD domain-containing protein
VSLGSPMNFSRSLCAVILLILCGQTLVAAQTVTADFANRNNTTPAVPSGIFTVGGIGSSLQNQGAMGVLSNAGLNRSRIFVSMAQVYGSGTTPSWGQIDWVMKLLQGSGVKTMVVLVDTPAWLQPSPNPCSAIGAPLTSAPPSSPSRWGQLAASVVAHLDQNFPGVVRDYEVWNEPELPNSFCAASETARLNAYVSLFGAAASAMHTQAKTDGAVIRTGGPVISRMALAATWLPALLNNSATAPYADFVSFHLYVTGQSDIDAGMTWATLFARTQSSTIGLNSFYQKISALVRLGKQPNAASTPIYISEYNNNWAFSNDCCRNHPTYGPLWNSVAVVDLLDSVYSGANAVPAQLGYFAATSRSHFCILGTWNSAMDCNPSQLTPYPQFYAYELFASPKYLNLQAGGRMAASVSPAANATGLMATAFYTSNANSVVIVNPTGNNYGAVSVQLRNTGYSGATGTAYLLNASNSHITTTTATISGSAGNFSSTVAVPAYSTVAVSLNSSGVASTSGPVAILTATPTTGTHPLVVKADSSQSYVTGSTIVGRTIDWGDTKWTSGVAVASHTYNYPGNYTIRLTIKDQAGRLAMATKNITIK